MAENNPQYCHYCCVFDVEISLDEHMQTHVNSVLKCNVCDSDEVFASLAALESHVSDVIHVVPTIDDCTVCIECGHRSGHIDIHESM